MAQYRIETFYTVDMRKMKFSAGLCSVVVIVLQGCIASPAIENPPSEPVAAVKPEIDYSDTSPDCNTAAQRIADNVSAGVPMREVVRLVGKPAYKLPGIWWWSDSFSRTGHPYVRYNVADLNADEETVTEISTDTSSC